MTDDDVKIGYYSFLSTIVVWLLIILFYKFIPFGCNPLHSPNTNHSGSECGAVDALIAAAIYCGSYIFFWMFFRIKRFLRSDKRNNK